MAIIGSAYVEIRALDNNLQRDIDKAMKKVKEPIITLQSNVNLAPVREKIRVLREELRKNPLKFSAEVDLDNVNEKIKNVKEEAAESFTIHADIDADDVRSTLDDIKEDYKNIHAEVKANADTAMAETQMRFLSRNRTSRVSAFIDPQTERALGRLFNTITGTIPAEAIRAAILGIAGNFETLAIKAGVAAVVIGSVGAAGLTLAANAVSIASDLGKLVGLAAMAPATISMFGAAITATVLGWKGFGDALSSDAKKSAKAMAELPPQAQSAANSLRGLGKEIRQTTQASYWKEMAGGIEQLHDNFFPMLKEGLKGTGTAMGRMTKSFTNALWEAGANGSLENIFKGVNQGLTNMNKGVKPFVDALFYLGSDGANHLGKLGDSIGDLGIKFHDWIYNASKTGEIDRWINDGVKAFKDLGRSVGAVYETFQGLNKAAKESGAKGLTDFANGLEKIADKVNTPAFQEKLVTVLKGARAGSDALGEGFGKISEVIGKGADTLAKFLDLAGQVGGGILTGIATMFDGTGLGDGLLVALQGAKEAVDLLQPAFHDFGIILGDLAEIAGSLFKAIAPGVVALMETMRGVVNGVKDGIIAAMPIFNDFIQNIVALASGPIIAVAEGIGSLLKGFSELPHYLQNIIMALGLAALIAPRIMKGFGAANTAFTKFRGKIRDGANDVATAFTGMDRAARQAAPRMSRTFVDMNSTIGNGFARTGERMSDVARTTTVGVAKTFAQAGTAMGNGFAAAGRAAGSGVSAMGKAAKADIADTVAAAKRGFKDMEILSRPMRANVKADLKDVAQSAKESTSLAGAYVREHSIYMEKRFADVGTAAKGAGKDIVDGFKAVGPNIRTQLNPAITEVQSFASDTRQAFAAVGSGVADKLKPAAGELRAFASDTRQAFAAVGSDVSSKFKSVAGEVRAFGTDTRQAAAAVASDVASKYKTVSSSIGSAFSDAAAKAKARLEPITSTASSVAQRTRTAFTTGVRDIADGFRAVGENVRTHMVPVVAAAETAATRSRTAFKTAALDIQGGIRAIGQNVSSAFLPISVGAENAARRSRDAFRNIGQTIATNFAPAHDAIRSLASSAASSTAAAGRSIRNFSTSAAQTIKSGIGSALGGLGAAFGGPWGIAIAGATVAIGALADQAAAKKAHIDGYAAAFNGQTGITQAVRDMVQADLEAKDSFLWMEQSSAADAAKNIGIGLDVLQKAAEGVPSAMEAVERSVESATAKLTPWQQGVDTAARAAHSGLSQAFGPVGTFFGNVATWFESDASKVQRKVEETNRMLEEEKKKIQETADQMGVPVNEAAGILKAMDVLANKASTAEEKARAVLDILKQVNGDTQTAADAQQAFNDKLRDGNKGWEGLRKAAVDEGVNIRDVFSKIDGSINTVTTTGSSVRTMFTGIADAGKASAAALAMAQQDPIKQQQVFREEIQRTRDNLTKKLDMAGIVDKGQIDKILKDLDLEVDPIKIKALLEGGDKALQDLGLIEDKKINPKEVPVSVKDEVTSPLQGLQGQVDIFYGKDVPIGVLDNVTYEREKLQGEIYGMPGKDIPINALDGVTSPLQTIQTNVAATDGKTIEVKATDGVSGPVGTAQKSLEGTKSKTVDLKVNTDIKPITTVQGILNAFKAPPAPVVTVKDSASAQIEAIQGKINAMKGKEIEVRVKDSVSAIVAQMQAKISGMKGSNPVVRAVDNATSVIRSIQGALDGMRDRTVTVTTVQRTVSGGKAADGGIVRSMASMFSGSFGLAKAKAFANGGVEKHVAQISAAQSPYRIWAEPETGGEAYIPLAKAKRQRSVKILEEVARMFGMTLLKTKAYANGGVEGGSASSGGSSASLSGGKVSAALVSTVAQEMMKDNRSLNDIGLFIVDGIIGGVNAKQGDAVDTMTGMAGSLEDAVRKRLDIHSPSKAFLALGKYIIDGLTISLKAGTGTVHKQISTLANRIYIAAADIKKATGATIGSSMTLLNKQKSLNGQWKKMAAWKYSDQIVDYYQKTGKTGNRTLADIVRAREDVNYRLTAAQKKLTDLQKSRADVFKDVSNQIRNEYKLGTSIVGQDKPYISRMKFSDVMNYTSGMAARLKAFNGKIAELRRRGVAPGLIQEVSMLGSIEGTSVANAILQGSNSQLKSLNTQYANVGNFSKAIGNTAADSMYKVGIDAQAGLVRGLQKDSASLTKAANQLTNQLIAQVKKNLGIRSPSRVMAEIGRYTGQGFIMGLDQMQPKLDNRVDSFINLDPRQVSNAPSTTTTTSTVSGSPLADKNITINVQPTQGMDERALAELTVREIGWSILSQ